MVKHLYVAFPCQVLLSHGQSLQFCQSFNASNICQPVLVDTQESEMLKMGDVKILGVKDGLFVGVIQASRGFLLRGARLIQKPDKVRDLQPIPGPTAIQATVLLDRERTVAAADAAGLFLLALEPHETTGKENAR